MAQQPNQPRQRAWVISQELSDPLQFIELGKEFKGGKILGTPANVTANINGSFAGINIKGEIDEVYNDLQALSDQQFVSASFQAQHPSLNNVNVNLSLNFALNQISVNIQNANNQQAEKAIDHIQSRFPRHPGPTESEANELSLKLVALTKEAESASQAAKDAEKKHALIQKKLEESEKAVTDANKQLEKVRSLADEVVHKHQETTKNASDVVNAKAQVLSDAENSRNEKENVGAIEAQIRQFFDEIGKNQKSLRDHQAQSEKLIKDNGEETEAIVRRNKELQVEIKEHLQKAVGASLFSAFQKRKEQISVSKWVWAALTSIAIIAQIGVFIWLAQTAADGNVDQAFYERTTFLLRSLASVPIIFFIGYAIRQYSREREFEELYSFKAAISFSLSPYLDLVESLTAKKESENYREFAVKTIEQIFDNPTHHETTPTKKGDKDNLLTKEILDKMIDFIEKVKS